jgi:hypothetical protein
VSSGVIGRPSGLPVIGWKVEPKGWWPELPGKAGEYNPPMAKAFKKVCRSCRKVEVEGLRRYSERCARTRNRAVYRISKAKSRSRVQKTGFSSIRAKGLTKADSDIRYNDSVQPDLAA